MKSLSLIFFFFCTISFVFAQDENAYVRTFYCQAGDTLYVGNDGKIRSEPNRSAKILQEAKIGMMLICERNYDYENQPKSEIIFNIASPFIAVKFESNGQWVSGYVWGGLIADVAAKDAKGNHFFLTRTSYDPEKYYFKGLVARIDGKTNHVVRADVDTIFSMNSWTEGKVFSGMGLSNVSSIFRATYYAESCGIFTISYYFAWDGKTLLQDLPTKSSVGDGGIYSYGEEILFPVEHKQGNDLIIVRTEESNYKDIYFKEIDLYELVGTTNSSLKIYKWDGRKARKLEGVVEE